MLCARVWVLGISAMSCAVRLPDMACNACSVCRTEIHWPKLLNPSESPAFWSCLNQFAWKKAYFECFVKFKSQQLFAKSSQTWPSAFLCSDASSGQPIQPSQHIPTEHTIIGHRCPVHLQSCMIMACDLGVCGTQSWSKVRKSGGNRLRSRTRLDRHSWTCKNLIESWGKRCKEVSRKMHAVVGMAVSILPWGFKNWCNICFQATEMGTRKRHKVLVTSSSEKGAYSFWQNAC